MVSKSSKKSLFTAQRLHFICTTCFNDLSVPDAAEIVKVAAQCIQAAPSYIECATDASKENMDLLKVYAFACEKLAIVSSDAMQQFDTEVSTREWFGMCEEAMHAIFHIHPCPDEFLAKLITSVFASWRVLSSEGIDTKDSSEAAMCRLARLLFVSGQGALCTLTYTERIASISKKAIEAQERTEKAEKDKKKGDSGSHEDNEQVDAMEEEMGMAAAADAEHEKVCVSYIMPRIHY